MDTTRYRVPAAAYGRKDVNSIVLVDLLGTNNAVLSRHNRNHIDWEWVVYCVRSGYQNRLDDFNALITQINNAIAYALDVTGSQVFLFEQYSTQTVILQYPILVGDFTEETRLGGGGSGSINISKIGRLSLSTRRPL